ncbi:glycosyltransferase [Paracoccus litorisediminis]|uniref:Glycosyl transferase n=1 Tax=Paracoccus litorisediminis TaxID=2006130 RepID=A0A844HLX5_9RHOB|nr:glycosyltransferase [Paracoccus litorisediminis]MTH59434.1 glycosyl transferase [Paracoccus litorisediminis]
MTAPRILFYVQHLLGIGHLARASRIAQALIARGARVTLVTGGLPVTGFPPPGLDHIALPALQTAGEGFSGLADAHGDPATPELLDRRRDLLLATLHRAAPDIVITEAFPFGRRQMRFELLPLLEAIAVMRPKPILCCSLRDILQEKTKPGRDAETVDLVLAHYDRVLVHGDPAFARLGDTFPLADRIADRVVHTGLVAPPAPRPAAQGFDVVLSAGGGAVGEGLATAALAAAAELPDLRLCLITGPNLPAGPRQALAAGLNALPQGRLLVETFRPDFAALLAASRLSVSQAGYNTVCDVLQAGCRAILIPFATGGETEQTTRATRLAAKGWADILPESALDGPSLAAAIRQALAAPVPSRQGLDLDGAGRTADILYHLADHRLTEVS